LITALAVVALAAAPASAQRGPMGHGMGHRGEMHGHGEMLKHMVEHLDLSETQREQIHRILEQRQADSEATRETMRAAHDTLADLMHAEVFDEAAIREAAAEVAAVRTEMIVEHARAFNDIRRVLTPEQLEQFQQMHQRHRERMEESGREGRGVGRGRHGRGHGHGKSWHLGHDNDSSE
jgi:protein CpxP